MVNATESMGWGMGLFVLLIAGFLVLGITAFVKYLMTGRN